MKFEYHGKKFAGSREQIIKSLKAYFTKTTTFLVFRPSKNAFYFGEEKFLLSDPESDNFNVDAIKRILIKRALNKVPLESFDPRIDIKFNNHFHYLFIDDKLVVSHRLHFIIDQILMYCNIDRALDFNTKIEIKELLNNNYALYLNKIPVACQDKPFTISKLLFHVIFFNRTNQ